MKTIDEIRAQAEELEGPEAKVLEILLRRGGGLENAISAALLAGQATDWNDRELRKIINHLIIFHRIPVVCMAGKGGGYFLPASEEEIEAMYRAFYQRAMTGLVKATRARKDAYIDSMVQMALGFDEDPKVLQMRRQMGTLGIAEGPPAWAQVATRMLDRITRDPETYKKELEYIREHYGDIFLPREQVRSLKAKVADLQAALNAIAA